MLAGLTVYSACCRGGCEPGLIDLTDLIPLRVAAARLAIFLRETQNGYSVVAPFSLLSRNPNPKLLDIQHILTHV